MDCFSLFQNLVEIKILQQPEVTKIKGVKELVALERLWMCDCSLKRIGSQLGSCVNLKELYLNGNSIESLDGLQGLHHLQKLWLCDNQIRSLAPFDGIEFQKCVSCILPETQSQSLERASMASESGNAQRF